MNLFENISKHLPTLVVFSVTVSTLYNAGFFAGSGHQSFITDLSYQDILTSSIFGLAALLSVSVVASNLYTFYEIGIHTSNLWFRLVMIALLVCGAVFLYFSPYSQWAWIFFVLPMTVLLGVILKGIVTEKFLLLVPQIAVFLSIGILAYVMGYSSYVSEKCFGSTYVDFERCKNCKLLKSFSDLLVVERDGLTNEFFRRPDNFKVYVNRSEADNNLKNPLCNPLTYSLAQSGVLKFKLGTD